MSDLACEEQWLNEWSQYNLQTYAVLGLTFVNIIVIRLFFGYGRAGWSTAPWKYTRVAQISGALGCAKIIGGIYLLSSVPKCPEGCICSATYVGWYPYLAIFLGVLWNLRALSWYKAGQRLRGQSLPIAQPVVASIVSDGNAHSGQYTAMGGK